LGFINQDANSVYRYMNFGRIDEYAETARTMIV
jgi:aconitase B